MLEDHLSDPLGILVAFVGRHGRNSEKGLIYGVGFDVAGACAENLHDPGGEITIKCVIG